MILLLSVGSPGQFPPKQIEGDDETLKRKRSHFIFYRGVLGFGIPTGVITLILDWRDHLHADWIGHPTPQVFYLVIAHLALWLATGYVWGVVMWKWFTKRSAKK